MDERHKWEQRYLQAKEPFYGHEPSRFLQRSLPLLPQRGRCLDAGGGEGRNALFLAARGWDVLLVDLALAGAARARRGATMGGWPLRVVVADLERGPLAEGKEFFDLVLAINFHSRRVIETAVRWLRPGGALVVEGFAQEQLGRTSGGPQDPALLWHANELPCLLAPALRVVWYEDRLVEDDDNPRHRGPKWVVRLVAVRPA